MFSRPFPYILLILLLGVAGCTVDTETRSVSPYHTVSPVQSVTSVTSTPTFTPSTNPTTISSPTPILWATPTKTLSPSPTATMTPPATLEQEQANEEAMLLLSENTVCPSPCLWGIMPEHTTLAEAQNIFLRLRHPLERMGVEDRKEIYANLFGFANGLSFTFVLTVKDNYVQDINLGIGLANFKGGKLSRPWSAFSPETLLREYGVPSNIEFSVSYPTEDGFPPGTAWYSMTMYFEEANLIVSYGHSLTSEGEFVNACPITDSYQGVGVWLGEDPRYPPLEGVALSDATSLTLEEFYDLMLGDPVNACFGLKASAFYP